METGGGVEHVSIAGMGGNVGQGLHGLGNHDPGNVQVDKWGGHLG